jgi:hypothetical protein
MASSTSIKSKSSFRQVQLKATAFEVSANYAATRIRFARHSAEVARRAATFAILMVTL